MNHALQSTLGNTDWLREHEEQVKALFPEAWTHTDNVNFLRVRLQCKPLGIDYRTEEQFAGVMAFLTKVGMIEFRPPHIRRAPGSLFTAA